MNTPVNFEIAKLLKEKGFDEQWNIYMHTPTIAEVVMWLYEKHGIWIAPKKAMGMNKWFPQIYKGDDLIISEIITNSPTEAYEAAIEHCLTNII
jgi:hypothetical protein